MALKAKLFKTV